jgi:RHS repeat-associated protein
MRGEPYQFFLNTPWGDQAFKKSLVGFFSAGAGLPRGPENQYAKSYTSFSSRFRFNEGRAFKNKPVAYFSEGAKLPCRQWDEETGNYYYGARYYDPKISLWLSVDPLAHEYPSWSPYNFTMNNPINLIDPDGRSVDPASQGDWNQHKANVTQEYQNTVGQMAQAVMGMMSGKGAGGCRLKFIRRKSQRTKRNVRRDGQARRPC